MNMAFAPRVPHLLRLPGGAVATVRVLAPHDRPGLQDYFRGLSRQARYNRFTGARGEMTDGEFRELLRTSHDRFAIVARMAVDGVSTIVSEARYAIDHATNTFEFGLSVREGFRGQGIGLAMMENLECRARMLGAERMFGDTLNTNDEMQGLGRKAGFALSSTPGDWLQVRLTKTFGARDNVALIPAIAERPALQPMAV